MTARVIRAALARASRVMSSDDRGSIVPLVLGFYVIAFMFVSGAVLASDVFNKQRNLQSLCDGAAVAASNAVNGQLVRDRGLDSTLPLLSVQDAIDTYLSTESSRVQISAVGELGADSDTVKVKCSSTAKVAFGGLIGHADGFEQHASATAEGRLD
ncbi:pilus assembly protein TadG-related protein [Jatrophihabitans sp. DSM 45814]